MLLRSVARAGPSSLLRASLARQSGKNLKTPLLACTALNNREIRHSSTSHAISNPTLAGIEKRWEKMSPQEQADLWMALRDRMKNDWHELTLQERKAAYWIAFGPHGPRVVRGMGTLWLNIRWTAAAVAFSVVLFVFIRSFAGPAPKTMNEQWQKMTNEYLKEQKVEPITGISSEGYKGKGMVQSPPIKGGIPKDEDE